MVEEHNLELELELLAQVWEEILAEEALLAFSEVLVTKLDMIFLCLRSLNCIL